MKLLTWLLLLGNVAFFAWQVRHPEPVRAAVRVPPPIVAGDGVNRLLLLSEVSPDEIRPRVLVARDDEPDTPVEPASDAPDAPPLAPPPIVSEPGPPAAPEPSLPRAPVPPLFADVVPPVSTDPGPPALAPGPLAAVPAGLPGVGPAVSEPAAPVLPPAPPPAPPRVCLSVGPLNADREIGDVRRFVVEQGGDPMLREDERREISSWWVYFPPLPSREEAIDRVERMKAEGVKDVFAIPRGDMANAISLGLFSRRESLERRMRQLRDRGYEASITPRYRTEKASWLDVELPAGREVTPGDLAARFPDLTLEVLPCTTRRIAGAEGLSYNSTDGAKRGYARSGL